ncbi:hypothetical protein BT67DRAFT_131100 [Trichocladium antarcticum]|uniref:Uncharacterized protein n=1 Tax=Trichocladium antarcticum TaxID=1450529 RepID=A0AAN6ZH01_9PEZI|nr:hypothetical protein BT67DRAFT_131100 [Trichocladium antarcticum]
MPSVVSPIPCTRLCRLGLSPTSNEPTATCSYTASAEGESPADIVKRQSDVLQVPLRTAKVRRCTRHMALLPMRSRLGACQDMQSINRHNRRPRGLPGRGWAVDLGFFRSGDRDPEGAMWGGEIREGEIGREARYGQQLVSRVSRVQAEIEHRRVGGGAQDLARPPSVSQTAHRCFRPRRCSRGTRPRETSNQHGAEPLCSSRSWSPGARTVARPSDRR